MPMAAKRVEELRVWRQAMDLLALVIAITERPALSKHRKFCEEWIDATRSVSKNIAEGFGRFYPGDFARFVSIARGSLAEIKTSLAEAHTRRLLSDAEFNALHALVEQIMGGLTNLRIYLLRESRKRNHRRGDWTQG